MGVVHGKGRKCDYYDWLRERERWTESRALIGYPSVQNGAILLARDTDFVPQFIMFWCFIPYNKSFIG